MSDVARERGGKPQGDAQSVGRRVSLPNRQSHQKKKQSSFRTSRHKKRGYLGRNFIPNFNKSMQQQQQPHQQKQWQGKKKWKKMDEEES